MDMEMNVDQRAGIDAGIDQTVDLTVERLAAAASLLEQTVERLQAKIAAAEQSIAELQARAEAGYPPSRRDAGTRKTLPAAMTTLLAKQGVSLDAEGPVAIEAATLDAALNGLSLEQRIAVKSQLIRAGLLS